MAEPLEHFFDHIKRITAALEQGRAGEQKGAPPEREAVFRELVFVLQSLYAAEHELREQNEQLIATQQIALRERERYYAPFEAAPDAYLITSSIGVIQEANRAAARLLNASAMYLSGKPLTVYVAASERRMMRQFMIKIAKGESPPYSEREFALHGRHGEAEVFVAATIAPFYDGETSVKGFRWLLRDVSERRRAQVELENSNRLLQSLVDASPLAIVSLDPEGKVRLWNNAAETIFGWTAAEVLGNPLPRIATDEPDYYWEHFLQSMEEHGQEEFETIRLRKDGTTVPVRVSSASLYDTNQMPAGILALMADLSEEYRYRDDLRAIKIRLSAVRDDERRRLAQDLHDEVVQQLVGLQFQMVHLKNLTREPNESNLAQVTEGLSFTGGELGKIVRLLRNVISDLRPPGLEEFGLKEAVETLCEQQRHAWPDPVPTIETVLPDGDMDELPMPISTVLLRVAQEGMRNVRRHANARRIRITLDYSPGSIRLSVEDDGEGFTVPPRLSSLATNGNFGLVGLMEQVESVGGTMEVSSPYAQEKHGTQLQATVPLVVSG